MTEIGLVNGSTSSVYDLARDIGEDPSISMPSLLLIKFDKYEGPVFPYCKPGIVLIFPATRQFEFNLRGGMLSYPVSFTVGICNCGP
jgi:hypothetical protein